MRNSPRSSMLAILPFFVGLALSACESADSGPSDGGSGDAMTGDAGPGSDGGDRDGGPPGPEERPYVLTHVDTAGTEEAGVHALSPNGTWAAGYVVQRIEGVLVTSGAIWGPDGQRAVVAPLNGISAGLNAIGDDGVAVGATTRLPDVDWPTVAGVVRDGVFAEVPGLGAPVEFSRATGIRGGVIIGVAFDEDEDLSEPFVHGGGTTRSLGSFGGESGAATGVNASGRITGWSQLAGDDWTSHGFVVQMDQTLDDAVRIEGLGGATTFARAINADGKVVGDSANADGITHAFLWSQEEGIRAIAAPSPGARFTLGRAINDQGQVVGDGPTAEGPAEAWYWDEARGKQLLDELVELPDGWKIRRAWSIANDGSIAATAVDDAGVEHPVVLRPRS